MYRPALMGVSVFWFMVLSLGTGYVLPPVYPRFLTLPDAANCFSVAGINGRIIYCFTL